VELVTRTGIVEAFTRHSVRETRSSSVRAALRMLHEACELAGVAKTVLDAVTKAASDG
jgi:hypothetical protein